MVNAPLAIAEAEHQLAEAEQNGDPNKLAAALEAAAESIRHFDRKRLLDAVNYEARAKALRDNLPADVPFEIEGYEVLRVLGTGSTAKVYRAKRIPIGDIVALKVFDKSAAQDGTTLQRLEREAKVLKELQHQNIVNGLEFGMASDGSPFLAMELVQGKTLKEHVQSLAKLDESECIRVAGDLCSALAFAHSQRIVHRDLKPTNVMLGDDGSVKLVDFGIASDQVSAHATLTATGTIMGTPAYMSPEQCLGHALDARSDIYSLGCLLVFMLTGKEPYDAANATESIVKHVNGNTAEIRTALRKSGVSSRLCSVIAKAMNKDREHRYASISDLRLALTSISSTQNLVPNLHGRLSKLLEPTNRTRLLLSLGLLVISLPLLVPSFFNNQTSSTHPIEHHRHGLGDINFVEIRDRTTGRLLYRDTSTPYLCHAIANATSKKISLHNADLSGCLMPQMKISHADLSGADLSKSQIFFSDFSDVNLDGALLFGTSLSSGTMAGVTMRQAHLNSARLVVKLIGVDASDADFSNADLWGCEAPNLVAKGAIFNNATLRQCQFAGANLSNANFADTKITGCNFENANLTNASLVSSKIQMANFRQTTLTGAALPKIDFDERQIKNAIF